MKEKLDEAKYPEFTFIPDFISITGSNIYGKHEPNDIDIVIRLSQGMFDYLFNHHRDLIDAIRIKFERIFPNKIVHLVPSSIGPDWDYLPVYDLILRPKKEFKIVDVGEPEFARIAYHQELRAASREIESQAKESKEKNEVSISRFFFPLKTGLEAIMTFTSDRKYNIKPVENLLLEKHLFGKAIAQKKYDGNRLLIYKTGKEIKVFSEDGRLVSEDRLQGLILEVKKLNVENLILDCEAEIWKEKKHLNREDVAGYLHRKGPGDDSGLVANCFDCPYFEKDIHKEDVSTRIEYLKKLNFPQETIGIPNTKFYLNRTPSFFLDSPLNLKKDLILLAESPASEGAMIKWGSYPLTGTSNNQLKWKIYEELRAIVLKMNPTKVKTVFNYEIGVRFKNEKIEPKEIWDFNGKQYHHIGRTYSTSIVCKPGDIITVRFHSMNLYQNENIRMHLYEPIFDSLLKEEKDPEYLDAVIERGKISGLLVEKSLKKFIENLSTYDPSKIKDEVLRDDYRIILAWYSGGIKKYNTELIEKKFQEILTELLKRQNTIFHPDKYEPKARELFDKTIKKIITGGVYLVEPHAEKLAKGKKKLIVKARAYENMLGKPLFFGDHKFIYGIVVLD